MLRLRHLQRPIVAAVQGACAGVGMSLALTADLLVASRSAYFLQAFSRIGLVPDGGATWLLPRLIGRARALELALLGDRLPAETAMTWGLINRLVDDESLLDEAKLVARSLGDGPTAALSLIRRAFWESEENTYPAQLALEAKFQRAAGKTADFREGVKAFAEKREARFAGR
jgi:2-(1,2-epoxy-1,2-dihydrophenyl)acetyl-CoA isomerase